MSGVLRAAGLPRRSLRWRDSDDALCETVMAIPSPVVSPDHVDRLIAEVLALREVRAAHQQPGHRALADAE